MSETDTIAAISTPPGNGAIGIIRLSGPDSLTVLEKVWAGRTPVREFEPRRIYVGPLRSLAGSLLDTVLVFLMKAPSSYTGEEMVEIQGHGGQVLMELVLENLVGAGARLAEPGEFTKRAFLNGRMDLAQAEAVADLIQASTAQAALLAERQLEGHLSGYVRGLRDSLKSLRVRIEATIDFPEEEDLGELAGEEIVAQVSHVIGAVERLIGSYEEGRLFREGLRIVLIGKPNVGKSSLFNALLREDRAIVHPMPGTTRDLIEGALDLKGLAVRLIDSAGIREGEAWEGERTGEKGVESEGIRRARERLMSSDLVFVVVDSGRPLDAEDQEVFEAVRGKRTFYLYNKVDRPPLFPSSELERLLGPVPVFPVSATEGTGLEELKGAIFSEFIRRGPSGNGSEPVLANLRHRVALEKGLEALRRVEEGCRTRRSLELVAADLAIAMDRLAEVTGEVTNEEILSEIFSKFCIGK